MAAFQAHPYDWCFLFLFRVLLQGVADIFFIFFMVAILATCPIRIPREFLEKSLVCSLLNMSAGWTYAEKNTNMHKMNVNVILGLTQVVICHDDDDEFFT